MRILYATDGWEPAISAGRMVERVANSANVEITTLTVASDAYLGYLDDSASESVYEDRNRAEHAAAVAAERLREQGYAAQSKVAYGDPAVEIISEVRSGSHDLTVMGTGVRTWVDRVLLGSVSTAVLHASPSSVMIVHQQPPEGPEGIKVLLGADGSDHAARAEKLLRRFADPSRCRIKVLSIAEEPAEPITYAPTAFGYHHVPYKTTQAARDQLIERAEIIAERAAMSLKHAGFPVDWEGMLGHAKADLLREADAGSFDLVVVGSRGLSPIRRVVLGSVSDHVVRHARGSLVVRA
jgi:nucleotide-binding universal stress UspA family protein